MAQGPSLGGQTHEHTEADISDLAHTDPNAIHDDTANEITGLTAKGTLVDADLFLLEDSEASYAKKKVQVVNIAGGGDTVFQDFDFVTATSFSDTAATLASKSITLAAGDVLEFEATIKAHESDAVSDQPTGYFDVGGVFSAPSVALHAAASNYSFYKMRGCFYVASASNSYMYTFNSHQIHGGSDTPPSVPDTYDTAGFHMYETYAGDLTGAQTVAFKVIANTGETGSTYWSFKIQKNGQS